jgi:hypothetical protein
MEEFMDELTRYDIVVELVAVGVEILFHSRYIGIGDILLAEELQDILSEPSIT